MVTKSSSQSQKKTDAPDSAASNPAQENFKRMFEDNVEQIETARKALLEMQDASFDRAREAIEASSKLTLDAITYTQRLAREWSQMGLDAMKRTTAAAA